MSHLVVPPGFGRFAPFLQPCPRVSFYSSPSLPDELAPRGASRPGFVSQVVSPERYLRAERVLGRQIVHAEIVPPRLGERGFGRILLTRRRISGEVALR
jgi:hypothetical protein